MNNILFVHFIFCCVCGFDKLYVLQTEVSLWDPSISLHDNPHKPVSQ